MISFFSKRTAQIRESGDKSAFDGIPYEGVKIRCRAGTRFFKRAAQRIFGVPEKKRASDTTPYEAQIDIPTICTPEGTRTTPVISPVPIKPFNPALSLLIDMFMPSNSLNDVYATGAPEIIKPVGVHETAQTHTLDMHDRCSVSEDTRCPTSGPEETTGFKDDPTLKATSAINDFPSPSSTVVPPARKVKDSSDNGVVVCNVMSLREKLALIGPLDELTARNLLAQLLCIVHRMHLSGVIHRNITPDSIMVDQQGNLTLCGLNYSVTFDAWTADPSSLPLYPKSYSGSDVENPYLVNRPAGHMSNVYIPCSAFFMCRASFNIDFAAIAFVYHEMRAGLGALPIEFVAVPGPNRFELRKDVLSVAELDFIERLLSRQYGKRFECVQDMMQHKVFSGIEWKNVIST